MKKLYIELNNVVTDMKKVNKNYDNYKGNIKQALIELDKNHNTSWAVEIIRRNKDNLNFKSLFYRGRNITYDELFEHAYNYAKSLKELGFKKGDEIPVCIPNNTPEFAYILLAISLIGGKINSFPEWLNEDYNIDILNKSKSDYVFISDEVYPMVKDKIKKSNISNVVIASLSSSLLKNDQKPIDPYKELEPTNYSFEDNIEDIKKKSEKNIISIEDFENIGKNYESNVIENVELDEPFAITYTSGTTNPGRPKAVIHSSRSLITLSRFKESDVSGMPTMKNMRVLHHIPTYTHMDLCSISDTLYEHCTACMEPIYDEDFFLNSILINKPNYSPGSVGFYRNMCNKLNFDKKYSNLNLPYFMLPVITGESMSEGEEKYFNYTSRKHKFGVDKLPFPLSPVTFSIGGGTGEASGIFTTLYKTLFEKLPTNYFKKNRLGLTPFKLAEIEVLNDKGEYCKINEPGLLVCKSPCEMLQYYYDGDKHKDIHVRDAYGKEWLSLSTYSYKSDSKGRIKMKGRLGNVIQLDNEKSIPFYYIEDLILKDTKNIMSCTLTTNKYINEAYVINIEMQPFKQSNDEKIIDSIKKRLSSSLPKEILNKLYLRVRTIDEGFPIAPSGKRNFEALKNEDITEKLIPVIINIEKQKVIKK